MPTRWAAVIVAAVLAGSCGDATPADPTTTTVRPTTSRPAETTPPPTTSAQSSTTTAQPAADLPDLLVAHSRGIDQVGPGISWFDDAAVGVAYPDLQGGVIFQRAADSVGPIEHLTAPGTDPSTLIAVENADRLGIVGVFLLDGAPTLAYTHATRLPNECSADDDECLWGFDVRYLLLYDLTSGTSLNLGTVGSFESDWHGYWFGADRYASVWGPYGDFESCVGFGPVSDLLEGATPDRWLSAQQWCRIGPPDVCPDEALCSGNVAVAVAPDGSTFAYIDAGSPDPSLIVADATTGAELRRIAVGRDHTMWALEIDFDGSSVLLNRRSETNERLQPLVVRPDGVVEELEFTGRATFWSRRSS